MQSGNLEKVVERLEVTGVTVLLQYCTKIGFREMLSASNVSRLIRQNLTRRVDGFAWLSTYLYAGTGSSLWHRHDCSWSDRWRKGPKAQVQSSWSIDKQCDVAYFPACAYYHSPGHRQSALSKPLLDDCNNIRQYNTASAVHLLHCETEFLMGLSENVGYIPNEIAI